MRSFAPLRLAAWLCLASALLCLFAPFRADWPLFALLPAAALAVGLAALPCQKPAARLALGLLPAPLLLLASAWPALIAGALSVLFCAVFLALGRFRTELWQYRQELIALVLLSALLALLSNLSALRSVPSRCMALACVLCAVLALRALRLGRAASPAWEAAGVGSFLLVPAAGAAAGAALWASLPLLQYLVQGLAALFGGAVSLWNSLWTKTLVHVDTIGEDFFEDGYIPYPTDAPLPTEAPTPTQFGGGTELRLPELNWGRMLLIALAVAAGAALLVLAIRLLRRSKRPDPADSPEEDLQSEAAPAAPVRHGRTRRRKRRAPKSNQARVRALYREYLDYLRLRGLHPDAAATTVEITAASAELLIQSDEPLRELYRKARYSGAELSDEDLRLAGQRLNQLISDENLRAGAQDRSPLRSEAPDERRQP